MTPERELALQELRCLLDVALRVPFAEHRWASASAKRHWYELETLVDWLAGPLHSLGERGNVDYVYRDAERFPGVGDADAFRAWAEARLADIVEQVELFRPRTPQEHEDFGYMLELTAELRSAVEIAGRLALGREASQPL